MKDLMLLSSVKITNSLSALQRKVVAFTKGQDGVTAIEYAVIAVAISGMLMVVFGESETSFLTVITEKFNTLAVNIKGTVDK